MYLLSSKSFRRRVHRMHHAPGATETPGGISCSILRRTCRRLGSLTGPHRSQVESRERFRFWSRLSGEALPPWSLTLLFSAAFAACQVPGQPKSLLPRAMMLSVAVGLVFSARLASS